MLSLETSFCVPWSGFDQTEKEALLWDLIFTPGQALYAPWQEDNEKPYYTDKPDWDAFGAMLLVAACRTYGEPVPPTVEKDWNFMENPVIARLSGDKERVWSLLRGATWWIPLSDSFLFQGPLPTNDTATIGTVGALRKELEKLNQLAWKADENMILSWTETEGYPVDGTIGPDRQYSKADMAEHTQYDTDSHPAGFLVLYTKEKSYYNITVFCQKFLCYQILY